MTLTQSLRGPCTPTWSPSATPEAFPHRSARPGPKEEEKMCRAFNSQFNEILLYHQVNNPDSLMWYHVPNGQKAAGSYVAKKLCGKLNRMDMIGWVTGELNTQGAIAGKGDQLMGARRGVPDYEFHWTGDTNMTGFIEVKDPTQGVISSEQTEFQKWCIRTGRYHAFAYSVGEMFSILQEWGIIKKETII